MSQDLEPAQHDDPDGPEKGWSAKDFGADDYIDDDEVAYVSDHVADGRQTVDRKEDL